MYKKIAGGVVLILVLSTWLYFALNNFFIQDTENSQDTILTGWISEQQSLDTTTNTWVNDIWGFRFDNIDTSPIKSLLVSSNKWFKLLDIQTNTFKDISYDKSLLVPVGMNSTPIKYLYFFDNDKLGFYDIVSNNIQLSWLSLSNFDCLAENNVRCINVIRSFSSIHHFLVVGGQLDSAGWYDINTWYLLNVDNWSISYLSEKALEGLWWRDCRVVLDGKNEVIYNLGCDWTDPRIKIDLSLDLIEDINFVHEDDYYFAWGFFLGHNRSYDNRVIDLDLYALADQKTYKNINLNQSLDLVYEYYVNPKSNTLIGIGHDFSYCFDMSTGKISPMKSVYKINNVSSVLDIWSNLIYVSTEFGIESIDIISCASAVIPKEQWANYRIEGFVQ